MSILDIQIYPSPFLRKKSMPVKEVGDLQRKLLDDMAETMYKNNGVGLAAVQVGINKQLIVVDVGEGLVKLANPIIVQRKGKDTLEEGCLSLPNICIKVSRPKTVTVKGLDENGKFVEIQADGFLSKALQHEIDHLKGVLIIDYASLWQRLLLRKKLKRQSVEGLICKRI